MSVEVKSDITGSVWRVLKTVGDRVEEEEAVVVVESMKMEIPVSAPEDGVITEIKVEEGDAISEGDVVAVIDVS